MKLYSYFRSSAAFRVRAALNLKNLDYQIIPVHLLRNGGEQLTDEYRRINPAGQVPTLIDNGIKLTQSLAIIEYLDEVHPQPPLLPADPVDRVHVRSLALAVACDIHPLNNLRVMRHLKHALHVDDAGRDAWYRHWCIQGLQVMENMLAQDKRTGTFCYGETPTMADCCLVPQIANARRYQCDLSDMPTISRINDACLALDAFQKAAYENQPDSE